jgi:methyl-accepting chemotaxis protein
VIEGLADGNAQHARRVRDIAERADSQSAGIEHITDTMDGLSEVAGEASAAAAQTEAVAHRLRELSEGLVALAVHGETDAGAHVPRAELRAAA